MKNRGIRNISFLITLALVFTFASLGLPASAYAQSNLSGLEREILRQIKAHNEEAARSMAAEKEAARMRAEEAAKAEAKKAAEERARVEARKAAEERARIRREEFVADKAVLKNSMRGLESDVTTSRYSSGLRGLSSEEGINRPSSGLRGLSANKTYSTDLRDDARELMRSTSSDITKLSNSSKIVTQEGAVHAPQRARLTPKKGAKQCKYSSSSQYTQYVALVDPEPIYFHSTEANFFRMGSSETQDKSLADYVDAFEQKVDVWKEEGGHEILTFVGDQITSFARATVSNSSVIGAQIMKIVDIISEAADLKNLHVNIANKSFDAIKRSVATNNPRYTDEALHDIQQKIDQYAEEKIGFKNSAKQTTSNLAGVWTRSRIR